MNLEIIPGGITLTNVMGTRSIIALFMGLVLQLSQAQLCLTPRVEKSCATEAHAMSCCEGSGSCHCATESRDHEPPTPLVPASVDLKVFLAKAPEVPRVETLFSPPEETRVVEASPVLGRGGYAGVPLSVAFCRFVI